MKKLFFILTFMFVGSFAFANTTNQVELSKIQNESIEKGLIKKINFSEDLLGTCYLTVSFYGQNGELIHQVVIAVTDVPSAEACNQLASDLAQALENLQP